MATVHRFGAYRVVIYPNDHRPPHVHVIGPDGEAVFVLRGRAGRPTIREVRGLDFRQAAAIARELEQAAARLLDAWEAIHGGN